MSNADRNSHQPNANSSGPSQWSAPQLIDGALCRQCLRCGKWFHVGWLAHHSCKSPLPRSR